MLRLEALHLCFDSFTSAEKRHEHGFSTVCCRTALEDIAAVHLDDTLFHAFSCLCISKLCRHGMIDSHTFRITSFLCYRPFSHTRAGHAVAAFPSHLRILVHAFRRPPCIYALLDYLSNIMPCKPLSLQVPSASYTSFNLQPPRTPGRRSFPSVQVITRPLALILFTIIKQCTNPRDVIYLIHPRLNNLAPWHERVGPFPHKDETLKKCHANGGLTQPSKFIAPKSVLEESGPTIVITEERVL